MKEKKTKKPRKPHLVLHSIGMLFATLLLLVAFALNMAAASFGGMLDSMMGGAKVNTTQADVDAALAAGALLAHQIEAEGIVLLQNAGDTLPLDKSVTKVNVFGWSSTQWLGSGSGSGRVGSVDTDFLAALAGYGIATNEELSAMYRDFQPERPYASNTQGTLNSYPEESCRLYEPDIADYDQQLLENAKAYSNTALVVFSRFAGESNDCPQTQFKLTQKGGEIVQDTSRTYLDLSTEEEALLAYLGANFENVVVVLNTGNIMTLGAIETTAGVDACLMAGFSGQNAASALPQVLWGETNPSGRTADTWAYDFATAASYANAAENGVGSYTNAEGLYPADGTTNGNLGGALPYEQVSYLDYAEGIYIGYKWYETADAEGYWNATDNQYGVGYTGVVQYPFGYGLSYSDFSWEVASAPAATLHKTGTVSVDVAVTNTGNVAGKDVVQLYYTAPYVVGEIEKSAVELGAFAKTDLLAPGESQTVTLTLSVADMASYDCYDANQNGFAGYELDAGEYQISLRRDAHTVEESFACTLAQNEQYAEDSRTESAVTNKFTGADALDGVALDGKDSEQNITYLTRADFAGTFPTENVDSRAMAANVAALNLYTTEMANAWASDDEASIVTGAKNGLLIEENGVTTPLGYQLGADYDDPQWDALLDQVTKQEMLDLTLHAYVHTAALDSVGKPSTREVDGPSQMGSFNQSPSGTGYPNNGTIAQTWNADLTREYGRTIGTEAAQLGYSGWYAPSTNMHRSPFNGRNYEYYSEDSLLSGVMCGNTVAGALDAGLYSYVKHFICNDGEAGIFRDSIYTWMTEQTLRETYLRPFQIVVEQFGGTGLMSSYGRIGAVWAGGSEALLTGVLRDEWNFHGAVITDYSDHQVFMNGDQALRAGGDLWMDGFLSDGTYNGETQSTRFDNALRRATKDVLYMYLNARTMNKTYNETAETPIEKPVITTTIPAWRVILVVVDVVAVVLFALAILALVRDVKLKKAAKASLQIADDKTE